MTIDQALERIAAACDADELTPSAAENIRKWLTEDRYSEYADDVVQRIADEKWQQLDDTFWTVIPFGTGGRRGKMYPIGSNAINDRTIGESAQGLADYVLAFREEADTPASRSLEATGTLKPELACAIAYDTRHNSTHFARLCAEIMAADGFTVYFLDGHRSTPELSFTVRQKNCACGIMVTASHNPPSDNAVKVYWSTGGQILPPHDKRIIDRVMNVGAIRRMPWGEAVAAGKVIFCQDDMDAAFIEAVVGESLGGPRDLKIVYSPLHGVGATAVVPALEKDGFTDVEVFAPHAKPDGDFPNVPGHVSNPENPAVFDAIIARAKEAGADLCIASDPDCDRIGLAAPLTAGGDAWATLSGNQICALLCDYVIENHQTTPEHFVVQTLVTTQLVRRIADSYGIRTIGDLLVGFKWIAGALDENGPEKFLFGCEESHGYMAGTYARDKDGAVAAMLAAELAAKLKADAQTLHEKLDALFWQHGAHAERMVSVQMPGSEGMANMKALMSRLRETPPTTLAGFQVARARDYLSQTERTPPSAAPSPLPADACTPSSDLVMLDLECTGNYTAVRPSGTEPKVKFYMFTYEPPEQIANLEDAKAKLKERLDTMEQDLRTCAGA